MIGQKFQNGYRRLTFLRRVKLTLLEDFVFPEIHSIRASHSCFSLSQVIKKDKKQKRYFNFKVKRQFLLVESRSSYCHTGTEWFCTITCRPSPSFLLLPSCVISPNFTNLYITKSSILHETSNDLNNLIIILQLKIVPPLTFRHSLVHASNLSIRPAWYK